MEDPLAWDVVFKTVTLMFMTACSVVIAGISLGDVADELITFFDAYDDDTDKEGTNKDSGKRDADGTAVVPDLLYHTALTWYSYFVLTMIAYMGYVFMLFFSPLDNVVLECDFDDIPEGAYDAAKPLFSQFTGYDSCMKVID